MSASGAEAAPPNSTVTPRVELNAIDALVRAGGAAPGEFGPARSIRGRAPGPVRVGDTVDVLEPAEHEERIARLILAAMLGVAVVELVPVTFKFAHPSMLSRTIIACLVSGVVMALVGSVLAWRNARSSLGSLRAIRS